MCKVDNLLIRVCSDVLLWTCLEMKLRFYYICWIRRFHIQELWQRSRVWTYTVCTYTQNNRWDGVQYSAILANAIGQNVNINMMSICECIRYFKAYSRLESNSNYGEHEVSMHAVLFRILSLEIFSICQWFPRKKTQKVFQFISSKSHTLNVQTTRWLWSSGLTHHIFLMTLPSNSTNPL